MPDSPSPDPATLCARPAPTPPSDTTPLAPPLQLSSVYQVAGLDQIDALFDGKAQGYFYARDGQPNGTQLEQKLAALEHAEAALVCASGMAAESAALLGLLSAGDVVALSDGLYGKTVALVGREMARFGVKHVTFDATRPETLRDLISPRLRVVIAETISNPLVRVADIAGLAEVLQGTEATLVIDHTMAPLLCYPLDLGADALTHSLTKLIGGHSDLLLGLLAGKKSVLDRATVAASAYGLNGNAFESWLALRGLATLPLRSQRACDNALELADRLSRHNQVRAVHYPGLPGHADHARARTMLRGGFGTILTIDLGSRARADAFIGAVEHIPFAPSFGDVSTTLSHPATTSHRALTPEESRRHGITPGLVRLSIGLEAPADLARDFEQALNQLA
ncbi:MAG: PLP-dependent transferase [Isosphaeraceae bacterium]